jgi:seryl-tRNA synthetase
MHDMGTFRVNLDAIAQRLSARGYTLPVEQFRELDTLRRAAITDAERLLAERNLASREVGRLRKEGADTAALQEQSRLLGEKIADLNKRAEELDAKYRDLLAGVPNLPHESVPTGRSAEDNLVVRTFGQPKELILNRRRTGTSDPISGFWISKEPQK